VTEICDVSESESETRSTVMIETVSVIETETWILTWTWTWTGETCVDARCVETRSARQTTTTCVDVVILSVSVTCCTDAMKTTGCCAERRPWPERAVCNQSDRVVQMMTSRMEPAVDHPAVDRPAAADQRRPQAAEVAAIQTDRHGAVMDCVTALGDGDRAKSSATWIVTCVDQRTVSVTWSETPHDGRLMVPMNLAVVGELCANISSHRSKMSELSDIEITLACHQLESDTPIQTPQNVELMLVSRDIEETTRKNEIEKIRLCSNIAFSNVDWKSKNVSGCLVLMSGMCGCEKNGQKTSARCKQNAKESAGRGDRPRVPTRPSRSP
jgi:hypothetical protein